MHNVRQFVQKYDVWLIALASLIVSIISTAYYFNHHGILAIPDAVSRIDIARRVVDFKQPGIQQIGGVWLPLPQILMIPFVSVYALWHNGLGGSIVSMASFVVASAYIYRLGKLITLKRIGGLAAAAILMLNPNVLYMQSTPMAEMLLIATSLAGIFYFVRWFRNRATLDLAKAALWLLLASLVRYEAWMTLLFGCLIILAEALIHRKIHKRINGHFFLFATLAFWGIALWVLWGLVIYHNPIYWFNGPYSAFNQQKALSVQGLLPTKHNLILSITTMFRTMNIDVGTILLYVALVGLVAGVISWLSKRSKSNRLVLIALVLLAAPAALDIYSLFSGNIAITPTLRSLSTGLRYGLPSIPFIAVLVAILVSKIKIASVGLLATILVVLAYLLLPATGVLKEATSGVNIYSPQITSAATFFNKDYKGGNILAGSSTANTINLVHSIGLPFKDYIQEGDNNLWGKTLKNPEKHVSYVILSKVGSGNPTPDDVYTGSYTIHKAIYDKYYDIIYSKNGFLIFALKTLHLPSVVNNIKPVTVRATKPIVASRSKASAAQNVVTVPVVNGDSESSIVSSEINNLDTNNQLTPSEYSTVETEMVGYIGDINLIFPGQNISINLTYLQQLFNQAEGLSSTSPSTSVSSGIANVTVTSGDSESLIVRQEIHLLDPNHELSSAQEAFVEGTMVQDLGNNSLIYTGQDIALNLATLNSLITSSKQLNPSQLSAWQVYGNNISY